MTDELIEIFAETLEVAPEELNDDTSPENNDKWDSLAAMNLVAAIEEAYDVELTTAEIMKMNSIKVVREVLRSKNVSGI